jgi:DNA-3-methyladenine glycosylase I
MSYDEKLAVRIRVLLSDRDDVVEKKMFGGLCFMVNGAMCCGLTKSDFMVRVGADQYDDALAQPNARPMDFTGRPLKGMVYVAPVGLRTDAALARWVRRGLAFVAPSSANPQRDTKPRCRWGTAPPDMLAYHDTEWGMPVADDTRLFEKLCLEGFQSGLSWRTILSKRENFRAAFRGFEFDRIARFTARDVERLLKDQGIVRHRGKIEAVINNARCARELVRQEGSIAAFVWRYEPAGRRTAKPKAASTSDEAIALSRELKKRGWKFVGPTTVYAFMQAMGLVDDHVAECFVRAKVERARASFRKPV